MGNTPSAEMPRKAHKLSKPQTGSRSVATIPATNNSPRPSNVNRPGSASRTSQIAPQAAGPVPSWPLASAQEVVMENHGSFADMRADREQKRNSGLFRTGTLQSDQGARRNSIRSTTASNDIARNGSRTTLAVADYQPITRAYSLQSQDTRASLVNFDIRSNDMQRDFRRDDQHSIIASPVHDSFDIPGDQGRSVGTAIPRNSSDASLYIPMRRRSMVQTPGVATRAQVPLSTKSSFRLSHPPTPSMSRRNSIEQSATRHLSLPPPSTNLLHQERAVTPCEDEFRQLGGMKFGSLRIINGSPVATPTPGCGPGPFAPPSDVTSQSYFEMSGSNAVAATAPNAPSRWEIDQPPVTLVTSYIAHSEIAKPMPMSPTHGQNAVGELQTTSKHTAQEDDLFEDDGSPEIAQQETLDVRNDPNAKPTTAIDDPTPKSKASSIISRSDSAYTASPSSSGPSRVPLSKSDSGYASKSSIRSRHGSRSKSRDDNSESRSSIEAPLAPTGAAPQSEGPAVSKGQGLTEQMRPFRFSTPASKSQKEEVAIASPKSLASPSMMRFPLLRPRESRDSVPNTAAQPKKAEAQAVSQGDSRNANNDRGSTAAGKPGKFHRLLSGRRRKSLPAAHATFNQDSNDVLMPSVPVGMEHHLMERNGRFPSGERRFPLRIEPSKETLKTILSVGSMELSQPEDDANDGQEDVGLSSLGIYGQPLRSHPVRSLAKSRSDETISALPLTESNRPSVAKTENVLAAQQVATATNLGRKSSSHREELARSARASTEPPALREARDENLSQSRRTLTKPHRSTSKPRELTSRISEPNFLSQEPKPHRSLIPDISSSRRTKTPPPLSMRVSNPKIASALKSRSQVSVVEYSDLEAIRDPSEEHERSSVHASQPTQSYGLMSPTYQEFGTYQQLQQPFSPHRFDVRTRHEVRNWHHDLSHEEERFSAHPFGNTQSQSDSHFYMPNSEHAYSGRILHHKMSHDSYRSSQTQESYYYDHAAQGHSMERSRSHQQLALEYGVTHSRPYSRGARRASLESRGQPTHQNPPFRVLHSYNSPAYRNVPIWG
ncbi:hypothetical protein B0I35DRAFT_479325 [Stachybotrys elegans]|uniref:Proteophosphoglycan ppg4 n=1 Tax=Stachybotrys elegans TaxID=80388 RepID=A0A8K0WQT3_9HYPO|nr:hypothetical protein B0I35DRAFT_479325 [Stachybotrys elegans]